MSSDSVLQRAEAFEATVSRSSVGDAGNLIAPGHSGSAAILKADATPAWIALLWYTFRTSLRAHALFIAIAVLYVGLGWLASWVFSLPIPYSDSLSSAATLLVLTATFLIVVGCAYGLYGMIVVRPARLMQYFRAALLQRFLTVERLCSVMPVLVLLPVVISTFTYFKFIIPYIRPFDLDPLFAEWDWTVHGGLHPWELLQPVLGHPYVSAVINFFYQLWLFVMWGVLLWQAFSLSRPRLRIRYLVTFVLLWAFLGNLAATLLSSAGPVYYGRVTGLSDPFVPLMEYLQNASAIAWLPALDVQEMLWQSYVSKGLGFGSGISAMPSMHLATSFSFVLLGFSVNRRLGAVSSVFAALIFVGSIHLGWHYAIDGYVAIVGTWAIWWIVGRLLDRPLVSRLLWGMHKP
jgi:hypothetical protein